jgi:hypothetical protein
LMPVITGAKVEVSVGGYESVAKFFLCPTNIPDHVSRYIFFKLILKFITFICFVSVHLE